MTTSLLPLELVDQFMEELVDDKGSLAQSSLVCRQWTVASSRLLFRKLCLHPQVGEHASYGWWEIFLLEVEALPRLSANVQELSFISKRADGRPGCDTLVLQHILASLPKLRKFEMNYLDFHRSSRTSRLALNLPATTTPLKLKRVELRNVLGFSTSYGHVVESGTSDSFGLAEFLNTFDEIKELQLDNSALSFMYPVTWHLLEATPQPLARPQQRPLQVQRVHLSGQQSTRSLAVLQHMLELTELKALRLQLSPTVLRLVDEFIFRSRNLEYIHLNLRLDLMSSRVPALVHCPQLKTLRISTIDFLPGSVHWASDLWNRAMEVLECAPPSLRRVILDVVCPPGPFEAGAPEVDDSGTSIVDVLDWTVFNAVLAWRDGPQILLAAHLCRWTKPLQDAVRSKVSARVRHKLLFGKADKGMDL